MDERTVQGGHFEVCVGDEDDLVVVTRLLLALLMEEEVEVNGRGERRGDQATASVT